MFPLDELLYLFRIRLAGRGAEAVGDKCLRGYASAEFYWPKRRSQVRFFSSFSPFAGALFGKRLKRQPR
jgi:hypothetical protein